MPAKAKLNLAAQPAASSRVMALPGAGAAMPRAERYAELQYRHGYFVFGRHFRNRQRHRDHKAARTPAPAESRPVPVPAAAPAKPNPRGPLRLMPARGVAPGATPYTVGEALPANLPHVTLAWRRFDLPEPPPGRLYARVGGDVLLITIDERIVESILPLE
ncbi:MAG: RcnB family protein [Paracoccaceae bacterium]